MKINELLERALESKRLKQWAQCSQKYWQVITFIFLGIVACLLHFSKAPVSTDLQPLPAPSAKSADTYIPAGYVLIPIDILNAAGLNNLIGDVGGTIDLYSATANGRRGRLIGQKIKLLKAPLNPDLFAVLVPENESTRILENDGGFIAVIHNPKSDLLSTKITTDRKKSMDFANEKIEIEYYEKETL